MRLRQLEEIYATPEQRAKAEKAKRKLEEDELKRVRGRISTILSRALPYARAAVGIGGALFPREVGRAEPTPFERSFPPQTPLPVPKPVLQPVPTRRPQLERVTTRTLPKALPVPKPELSPIPSGTGAPAGTQLPAPTGGPTRTQPRGSATRQLVRFSPLLLPTSSRSSSTSSRTPLRDPLTPTLTPNVPMPNPFGPSSPAGTSTRSRTCECAPKRKKPRKRCIVRANVAWTSGPEKGRVAGSKCYIQEP